MFKKFPAIPLREIFTAAPNELLDVIGGMLSVNPLTRPSCTEALQMPYFRYTNNSIKNYLTLSNCH